MGKPSLSEFVFQIFEDLISNKLKLKGEFDNRKFSNNLLSENYYKISYDLIYDGDNFEQMSEGKKAFVILKLLLDFSNKECPILIDQPEDDLDNRAIYTELAKYLRKMKIERQIILVTHNPNIVVGADSELVIVANQQGIKNKNTDENKKFQYVTGSIENTRIKDDEIKSILDSQGIREHVCDILEGGTTAFINRERKYAIK
jgi:predicted ATP-dependent endonuclease of OLD family